MKNHLEEFKQQGYTVIKGLYDQETVVKWKSAYYSLLDSYPAMERERTPETGAQVVLDNMVERDPKLMLPTVTRNDRRLMRLFGEDDLAHRRSMSTGSEPEEELWEKWIREDREVLAASS